MRGLPVATAVAAALMATSSLAGCGSDDEIKQTQREPILRAATSDVERLLSYSAATLDEDRAEVADVSTKTFAQTYTALLSGKAGAAIADQKATSTAVVTNAGTVNYDSERPEVMLFVRQTTKSKKLAAPRLDFAAVRVHLRKVDGRWRIDSLDKVTPVRADGAKK